MEQYLKFILHFARIAAKGNAPPQLKAIIPWEGINETGPGGGYGGMGAAHSFYGFAGAPASQPPGLPILRIDS